MSVLNTQVMNLIVRGVLESTDDAKGVQVGTFSLLHGEKRRGIERVQNYGFSSSPLADSEAIIVFPGGDRSAGVVVALDDRATRMSGLQAGEVAIYTHEGDSIVLGTNNEITITTKRLIINAEERVTITSPIIEFNP